MSIRDYAVEDYGIVLKKDDLKKICMNLFEDCTDETWEEDYRGFVESLKDEMVDLCYCGNFTGEAFAIDRDGRDDYSNSIAFSDDSLYYVPIQKYPTLFEAAYKCFEDIVADFTETMSSYVPSDFDFTSVRHIVGTYFG
jgi:hypothetical protein